MKLRIRSFVIVLQLACAVLCLYSAASSQTSEKYFDAAKSKLAEADKLGWRSDKWKAKLRSSLADANEAIKIDPKNASIFAKRAEIKELLGDFDLALEDSSTAISLAPGMPAYYALRGSLRYQIEAIKRADEREKLDDPDEAAKIVADHKGSLEDYNKAISLDPKNPLWYGERGQFFESTKQPQLALADFTTAIEIDPRNLFIRWLRGILRSQLGLYEEALLDYTKILEGDPKRTAAFLARAEVYEALKQHDKSIAETTSAHKTAPNSPGILEVRAERYRMIGKVALARKDELAAKRLRRSGKK